MAQAKEALLQVVRRDPRCFGIEGTRWTLASLHAVCDWLRTTTPAGLSRLLDRLGITWKGAQAHVHSPDPHYTGKRDHIVALLEQARHGERVLLYLDELTYYRQPGLAHAYETQGRTVPRAEQACQFNTPTRVLAAVDARDGRVLYTQGTRVNRTVLVAFYQRLCTVYPGQRLYVVQDNWPHHFHPDVLVALEPQESRWPIYRSRYWSDEPHPAAVRRWKDLQLPVQLVPLPTYASWLNPIEKLWRKLKQEVLHLHRLADNLGALRALVVHFLDQFQDGSPALLRYIGLLVPD